MIKTIVGLVLTLFLAAGVAVAEPRGGGRGYGHEGFSRGGGARGGYAPRGGPGLREDGPMEPAMPRGGPRAYGGARAYGGPQAYGGYGGYGGFEAPPGGRGEPPGFRYRGPGYGGGSPGGGFGPTRPPGGPRGFARGQFLPPGYWAGAVADPRVYHLRRPPNGYGWVLVGSSAYLIQRATGLILDSAPLY